MTDKTHTIRMKDFKSYLGGRYRKHGTYSGEEYRDDYLLPALVEHERVCVDLTGIKGVTSSCLEEIFGGAVRKIGWRERDRIQVKTEDKELSYRLRDIRRYMREEVLRQRIAELGEDATEGEGSEGTT